MVAVVCVVLWSLIGKKNYDVSGADASLALSTREATGRGRAVQRKEYVVDQRPRRTMMTIRCTRIAISHRVMTS